MYIEVWGKSEWSNILGILNDFAKNLFASDRTSFWNRGNILSLLFSLLSYQTLDFKFTSLLRFLSVSSLLVAPKVIVNLSNLQRI